MTYSYQRQRLAAVRGLARYCNAIGLDVQVPAANALRTGRDRRTPHIYTQDEIDTLIHACPLAFAHPLIHASMATIIGLLAVTGMRPGEALRLTRADLNPTDQTLLIRANKHNPDRLIPIHPTTVDVLTDYQANPARQAVTRSPDGPLFVTIRGGAYQSATVEAHFARIRAAAGIAGKGTLPCLHDLRHTFATRQMIRAYTTKQADPAVTLALLATWLGHCDPSHTYWYVQAVPELLALAANRIDPSTLGVIQP